MALKNKIQIIEDTLQGAVEKEVNLEDLTIPELRDLVSFMPSLEKYLQMRREMDQAGIVAFGPEGEPVYRVNQDEVVSLFCVMDKDIDQQVAVLSVSGKAMLIRKDHDWRIVAKNHPLIEDYCFDPKYRIFQIDWDKDPVPAADLDPADDDAWEHQLVQAFDKGEKVGMVQISKYAFEIDPEEIATL